MENKEYSRRKFINKCLSSGSMFLGAAIILNSCNSKKSGVEEKNQSKSGEPCDDLSNVSAEEIEKREKFGYVKKSTDPKRFCGNCSLHIPPVSEKDCGGCMLFKGPVDPEGSCIQFVAKV
ncbi:MAG TPA: hypothetical protein VIM07_12485 [Chitinophagaceae bacterium]